jgi:uncharacterized protein (TIGR03435 family)
MRYRLLSKFIIGTVVSTVVALAQTPPAPATTLAFEVASIKPAGPLDPMKIQSGQMRIGMKVDKGLVDIGAMSLTELICLSFKVKPHQVAGPSWLTGDRFNIKAKIPDGATEEQVPEMLQALLIERFKLSFHKDTKEAPVYALIVAKGGHKMKEAVPEKEAPPIDDKNTMTVGQGKDQVKITGDPQRGNMVVRGGGTGTMRMAMGEKGMKMEASAVKMEVLVEMLGRFVDRPVVDQTELKGEFQVTLELSMEDLMNVARAAGMAVPPGGPGGPGGRGGGGGEPGRAAPAESVGDPGGGSIFQSVQQLGLKLDPRKAPIDRIVIDHVEKAPTEN